MLTGYFGNTIGLAKTGNGLMALTAANTYTGPTQISGGTLQLGTGTSGQDGSIAGSHGVTDNAALVYALFGNQTAGYAIGGSGSLTKTGGGLLMLAGANTYTGGTSVENGTLQLGSNNALGLGGLTADSGAVDLNGFSLTAANGNALPWLAGAAGLITAIARAAGRRP